MIDQIFNEKKILIAGHRGYRTKYPENTLLSFKEAILLGVDMIELDLQLSKDKEVVIFHDLTLDRTTNMSGNVRDYTVSELKQVDVGIKKGIEFEGLKIPTFVELCELCREFPYLLFNIEIKEYTFECVDYVMELIKHYDLKGKSVFTCFDANIIEYMFDKYGVKTQGFPSFKMANFKEGEQGTYSKMTAVGISMELLEPQLIKMFKEKGICTWSYTPNTEYEVLKSNKLGITLVTVDNVIPALKIINKSQSIK